MLSSGAGSTPRPEAAVEEEETRWDIWEEEADRDSGGASSTSPLG